MPQGECIKQDFFLIANNPDSSTNELTLPELSGECCFKLQVFADTESDDAYKNDSNSILFILEDIVSEASLYLESYIGGSWVEVIQITDNTYGTFHEIGFYVNKYSQTYIGLEFIDWKLILQDYGSGCYRFRLDTEDFLAINKTYYSNTWELNQYDIYKANESVRIEYYNNGLIKDSFNDSKFKDFGSLNYYNSIRIPNAFFGYNRAEREDEYREYNNASLNWIKSITTDIYKLEIESIPSEIVDLIKNDILNSDNIYITDYNYNNPNKHISRGVIPNISSFEPNWIRDSQQVSLTLDFRTKYNTGEKRRY